MTEYDGALGRLLAQVGAGTDCLVEGTPAASRSLFARAAAVLAERADVITVVSPLGELGLSSLIAQISGRPDFNEQDDAVLELGFKRLMAPGRQTVLMLGAPQGIGLPALRYLQHVGRSAPGLLLVVLDSPALDVALEQPGAIGLRARLRAGPVISANEAPALLPVPVEAVPLVALPGPIPLSSPAPRQMRLGARLLPWAAAMVSVAAASVIVVQLSRVSDIEAPMPAPTSTPTSAPVTQTSTVIAPAPTVETPIAIQPPAALPPISFPAPAIAPPLPPLVKPDRVLHARRADPKPRAVARAARPNPEWRTDEPTQYSWDYDRPAWRRRDWRWEEQQRQGAYAVDPYGTPLYPFSR